ncbi:MAG TPA: hypothetical protein DEF34_06085 [Desulfotomaculum sp.]|nr:hypothetical protein [Desulfotomaculum sp.]
MIKDRFLLGIVSGLTGNAVKIALGSLAMKYNLSEFDGPVRASSMLLPAHKITGKRGKVVGYLADNIIAATLGIVSVYALSITGKDRATLKGALAGGMMWTALYGVFGTMGATRIRAALPKTALTEFFVQTVYGAVTATVASKLGASGLFENTIPLSASAVGRATTKNEDQEPEEVNYTLYEPNHPGQPRVH